MKFTKIVSVIVVLTMITSSLVLIAGEMDPEGAKADTNCSNVTEISMTELVAAKDTYWINADPDANDNITITLATSGTKSPCIVDCRDDTTYVSSDITINETNFTISEGCGFKADENKFIAKGNVIVNGGELSVASIEDTDDNGLKLQVIDGSLYAGSIDLKNNSSITLDGGYFYISYDISMHNNAKVVITINDGEMYLNESVNFVNDSTITVNDGYLYVYDRVIVDGGILTINMNGGIAYIDSIQINDGSEFVIKHTGGLIDHIFIAQYDGEQHYSVELDDLCHSSQSNVPFVLGYDKENTGILVRGPISGYSRSSELSVCTNTNVGLMIDDLEIQSLVFDLSYCIGKVILNSDFVNIGKNAYSILPYGGFTGNKLVSASGEHKFVSLCAALDDEDEPYYYYINGYLCDISGVSESKTSVRLVATEGISKIDTGSEYGDYVLSDIGKTINLDNIKVECIKGYTFDGWYYVDDLGVTYKVTNTQSFMVTEGALLYAKAVPSTPASPPDYTALFTALLVVIIVAIVLGALYILMKEGIFGKKA